MKMLTLTAATLLAATAVPAAAAPIIGLYNTGANVAGTGVSTGNVVDRHWGRANGTAFNGGTNGVFPIGPWLAETGTSRWLTPTGNAGDSVAEGNYFYTLTFDLTGFNSSTATFTARAAADDSGELFLNDRSIGTVGSFEDWTEGLTANSGFNAGLNTLTFRSFNGGGPAGARLEFVSSDVAAVPEPATWGMMLVGFGMIGFGMRRRKSNVRTTVRFA